MDRLLAQSEQEAKAMRDEYISVEHLFLALLETADDTVAPLLRDYRITKEDVLKTLQRHPRRGARHVGQSRGDL